MMDCYKDNSFDIIRHVASIFIMVSHYTVLLIGKENVFYEKWLFAGASLVAFFVICGFFLIPSLSKMEGKKYIVKRIIRIYPLYIISIFITVGAAYIVPIVRGGYTYPSVLEAGKYAIKMIIKPNTYVINGISNGAIWAIFIELQVYILVAIFRKTLLYNS